MSRLWSNFVTLSEEEFINYGSGTNQIQFVNYLANPSGSSYNIEWYDEPIVRGHHHIQDGEELWKCEGCGNVFRVKDTLECFRCGHPITEKSRFVLE